MIKFPKIQKTKFSASLASVWYAAINTLRKFTEHFPFTNGGTALLDGEVLRISGNRTCVRAEADDTQAAATFAGVSCEPTAQNAQGVMRTQGLAMVLFEPGLVAVPPAAGLTAYVGDIAGRASTVEGTNFSAPFGTIEDASLYDSDGICYVNINRCCQPVQAEPA